MFTCEDFILLGVVNSVCPYYLPESVNIVNNFYKQGLDLENYYYKLYDNNLCSNNFISSSTIPFPNISNIIFLSEKFHKKFVKEMFSG